jgi:hypothetical protein
MAKKDKKKELPTVHPELAGFEMNIDSLEPSRPVLTAIV